MKKLSFTLILATAFLSNIYSQTADTSITFQKNKFYINGERKKFTEIKQLLKSNPASVDEFNQFKSLKTTSLVISEIGLFTTLVSEMLYLPKFNDASQLKYNPDKFLPIGIAGLSVFIIGQLIQIPTKKHLKKSIDLYNSNGGKSANNSAEWNFIVNNNGLGVSVCF